VKNITIGEKNYTDVEKIKVRETGTENYAEFIDAVLDSKTITANGTYNASDDNLHGYSSVNVETSGADLSEYIGQPTEFNGTKSAGKWITMIKKLPEIDTNNSQNLSYFFAEFSGSSLDLTNFDTSKATNISYLLSGCRNLENLIIENLDLTNVKTAHQLFANCRKIKRLDLSKWKAPLLTEANYLFTYCIAMEFIDLRSIDLTKITSYLYIFGQDASNGVPDDCLIIVKDDTAKTWITEKYTRLTNVKTVAEYEASL